MADRKNQGTAKNSQKNGKSGSSSLFNRSISINYSTAENKPSFGLYGSPPSFHRHGSIRTLYSSSLGSAGNSFKGKVKKLRSLFNPQNSHSSSLPSPASSNSNLIPKYGTSLVPDSPFSLPGTEDRVVIYFTSLRGIRRTFQDCHSVRMIFRGFRVNLDERDISMDAAYRRELHKVFGESNVSLPQVFIKGKYIGGAELVKQLVEVGELAKLIKGLPLRPLKPCEACDDWRFIPCTNCHGSHKVFEEDEEWPKTCPDCNENGLLRCPLCAM